jgi:acyl-CoA thioester hydrolase
MPTGLIQTNVTVLGEWVDNNGHMNLAFYVLAFDKATDNFYDQLQIGLDYRAREHSSMFTLGINVDYIREVFEGDQLRITTQLLDCDEKRMRYIHCMYKGSDTEPVAINECLAVHVDMAQRKSVAFPAATRQRIEGTLSEQRKLPLPKYAGRILGDKL